MERDLLYRYFDGDTTPDEERRIMEWAEASPENYRLYLEERRLWCALLLHAGRRTARRPALWRRLAAWRVSGAAACILLLVGLAGIFFAGRMVPDGRMQQVVVPAGQRVELRLADGTKVWLNSSSSVEYVAPFFSRQRRVKMEGEAYFEVEHDRRAPFVVSTNGLDIEVLGTRFNIRNDDNEHRVTTVLLEGAVKAYASGREQASVRLHPAQQLVFDTRTHAMRLTDCPSAERSINWIDGRFCFEHDTFGEIVAELKRYYNVDIRFMDNRLRDMRFSGNFRVEDGIYHIMSVLQLTYKFNYRIAGNDSELYANPER